MSYDKNNKMSKLPITEKQLVQVIIEYLNSRGHFAWRNNTGVSFVEYRDKYDIQKRRAIPFSIKGAPDVLGYSRKGVFIGIECKVGYNKPTEDQLYFIEKAKKSGAYALVAYNLDQVIATGL